MEKFKYPLVKIIWDDAESDVDWREVPTEPLKPSLALSVGFLIKDEENYVLIADTYFLEGKVIGNTVKIPRGMIKEMGPVIAKRPRKVKPVLQG